MKRTIALALLGFASVGTVMGQGHVVLANYVSPYNSQIQWDTTTTGKSGVAVAADGLQFQVFYGEGNIIDASLLEAGVTFGIDDTFAFNGGGWYNNVLQVLPNWASGDVYTFQIRTLAGVTPGGPIDTVRSVSALWTELSEAQGGSIWTTGNPPKTALNSVGLTVYAAIIPEPSTFALAGLGAAALLIFRRRA